jgi:hypothetical protein
MVLPMPAWAHDLPSGAQITASLEERLAGRDGEGLVVALLEPAGTQIIARGPEGMAPASMAAPSSNWAR